MVGARTKRRRRQRTTKILDLEDKWVEGPFTQMENVTRGASWERKAMCFNFEQVEVEKRVGLPSGVSRKQ